MGNILSNRYAREYYVVFEPIQKFRWWNIFTGKKFAHIKLITNLGDGRSLLIDPTIGGMYLVEDINSAYVLANLFEQQGSTVIKYVANGEKMLYPTGKLLRSCVSIAKDMLGINNQFILTPYQLYRRLK